MQTASVRTVTGEHSAASTDQHYFSAEPTIESNPSTVDLHLEDFSGRFTTDRGVFAKDRIDPGTKLLLSEGPPPDPGDQTIVDIGAGYGPIAVVIARRNPQATVWAVEPNKRARELCLANARACGAKNVRAITPDEWPEGRSIDRIWSNPPIRIGKNALHDLLRTWLGRLDSAGTAHLVVQKHLGADSLQRWLTANSWATTRRRSRAAYRLLDVNGAGQDGGR